MPQPHRPILAKPFFAALFPAPLLARLVRLLFPALLLACLAGTAQGVVVPNLYRAEVDVPDHSAAQLNRAVRSGLAQVLIKLSGSRAVLRGDAVRGALADGDTYLQQYQYQRRPDGTLALGLHYDEQLVRDLLDSAGAPLWGANRPQVLVWLVVDEGSSRRIATPDNTPDNTPGSAPDPVAALGRQFERRGVPVVYPLLDLRDKVALPLHSLWQFDRPAIQRASRRYGFENVLAVRLGSLSDGRWLGDWLFLQDGEATSASFHGEALEELGRGGAGLVAEAMAARYAVPASGGTVAQVSVRVDGVPSYAQYRALTAYLEGIELVETAHLSRVSGGSMVFSLRARGGMEPLRRAIALGRRLRLQGGGADGAGPVAQLSYRWVP